MATYLPGVTDYIPQIQPFTPDYNFYSQSLDFSQGKYDAAKQRLSNMYGSLLNAPLTREDNVEARDKFFKTIDQDIKRMSAMDLSLEANSQAASEIFNQLTDNQAIVKDMVWTKQFQNEQQRAQGFKNCTDAEKCGGAWWEGGERALAYNKMEFQNASAEEAMNMGNASFVAYQDVTKMAMDLAKEADLNVSVDSVTGQWITTTKNGAAIVAPLQNLFAGIIGKDPKVAEYYKTKASIDRKDFMYSNEEAYGSLEAAENAYITQRAPAIEKFFGIKEVELKDNISQVESKQKKVEKKAQTSPPSKQGSIAEIYNNLNKEKSSYSSSLEDVENANGSVTVAQRNQRYSGDSFDRLVGQYGLSGDILNAADVMSKRGAEFSVKANPYGVEAVRHKNRMLLEDFNFQKQWALNQQTFDQKLFLKQLETQGGAEANIPNSVEVKGGATVGDLNTKSYDNANRGFNVLEADRDKIKAGISNNEQRMVQEVITRTGKAAETGDVQAKEDYVALAESYMNAASASQKNIGHNAEDGVETEALGDFAVKAEQMANATTLAEKYNIARSLNMDPSKLAGGQIDNMYESSVTGMLDPTKAGNDILRDYLDPIRQNGQGIMRNIQAKRNQLDQMDKFYAKESKGVIADVRADSGYGDAWADAFDAYIGDDGYVVDDEATFVKNMMTKGYSANVAKGMWGADKRLDFDEYIDDDGTVKSSGWTGAGNVIASGVDLIATTAAGVGSVILSPLSLAATGIHNFFTDDENDWKYSNVIKGFEYDDPEDVANWGSYGAEGSADSMIFDNTAFQWEDDNLAKGRPGVHDMWKRAYTKHAKPDGSKAWMGATGAGDYAAQGMRYDVVDPAQYRGVATQGVVGLLKDAGRSSNAVFSLGDFDNTIPENDPMAKNLANLILGEFVRNNNPKDKNRIRPQATYSNIAGGDVNTVGLNIKPNPEYLKKIKGTAKNPGPYDAYLDSLATEGLTVYVPKAETNNVFTQGSMKSANELLMDHTGQIEFNAYPDYTRDLKIELDPNTGSYKTSGHILTGTTEDGRDEWGYIQSYDLPGTDLNQLVNNIEAKIREAAEQNMARERTNLLSKQ